MKLLIPPPIVALICGLMMWGVSTLITGVRLALQSQEMLASVLIVVGFSIDLMSILAFRRAKTTVTPLEPEKASKLVVTGLYRVLSKQMHPIENRRQLVRAVRCPDPRNQPVRFVISTHRQRSSAWL